MCEHLILFNETDIKRMKEQSDAERPYESDPVMLEEYLLAVKNGEVQYDQQFVDYLDGWSPDPRD